MLKFHYMMSAVCLLMLSACSSAPQSTRMTVADFTEMAGHMSQSLLRSTAIAQRSSDSPKWVVAIDKVVNLTDDMMTEDEQWAILSMLRGATPIVSLRHTKNLRFVVEPATDDATRPAVTHSMTAVFRSVGRMQTQHRSDLYYCEFEMLDLRSGEPVWIDKFEFKRVAEGHAWD